MEINGVTPSSALQGVQAVEAALAEIADEQGEEPAGTVSGVDLHGQSVAGLGDGQGSLEHALGAGHGVERSPKAATAESDAVHPDARPDRGAESALVQSFARPDTPLTGALRPADNRAATPALAGSEFTLPADQLLNAAVIGLQVESAFAWQLQRRGFDAAPQQVPWPCDDAPAQAVAREEVRRVTDHGSEHHTDHDADDGEAHRDDTETQAHAAAAQCGDRMPDESAAD
ncbi:MAG TPA: hypothetical protein VKI18_14160, partial [Albitalea sp.]|nr:hypothetical protein [Albitalea sp.]